MCAARPQGEEIIDKTEIQETEMNLQSLSKPSGRFRKSTDTTTEKCCEYEDVVLHLQMDVRYCRGGWNS